MKLGALIISAFAAVLMTACGGETTVETDNTTNDDSTAVVVDTADEVDPMAAMMAEIATLEADFTAALSEEEQVEVARLKAVFDAADHDLMMSKKDSMMEVYSADFTSALAIADAHPEQVNKAMEIMMAAHDHPACGPDCTCDKCQAKAEGTCGPDCTCDKCKAGETADAHDHEHADGETHDLADGANGESTCGPDCTCDKCAAHAEGGHGDAMALMSDEEKTNMMKVHFVLGGMNHDHAHGDHDHGDDHGHGDHDH